MATISPFDICIILRALRCSLYLHSYFGLMPFRGHCIDTLSRGSDLQFDSRPMEIYDAVNLIDSALTFVAGSFMCEYQILKNLAGWHTHTHTKAMTWREYTASTKSNLFILLSRGEYYAACCVTKRKVLFFSCISRGDGTTQWRIVSRAELKFSRCEVSRINEKFERRGF